jgi:hypothetical protein
VACRLEREDEGSDGFEFGVGEARASWLPESSSRSRRERSLVRTSIMGRVVLTGENVAWKASRWPRWKA